jgi:hypothetical protein
MSFSVVLVGPRVESVGGRSVVIVFRYVAAVAVVFDLNIDLDFWYICHTSSSAMDPTPTHPRRITRSIGSIESRLPPKSSTAPHIHLQVFSLPHPLVCTEGLYVHTLNLSSIKSAFLYISRHGLRMYEVVSYGALKRWDRVEVINLGRRIEGIESGNSDCMLRSTCV